MPALERNLQKSLLNHLKKLRQADPTLLYRKKHGTVMGVAGDPDLYGAWSGVPFAIELKRPGEEPTPLQSARLREWHLAGAVVGVVRNLTDLEEILQKIRRTPAKGV